MLTEKDIVSAVKSSLSPGRMSTYETAAGVVTDDDMAALDLYGWNADVSGALLTPLHICEVVVRNAVAEALTTVYGPRWPWESVFEVSLPDIKGPHYNPRRELQTQRRHAATPGKVIPELSFMFWQSMFTKRHDSRLWASHLFTVLPNVDRSKTVKQNRESIHQKMDQLRKLRNRIAHHEPIFNRNLVDDIAVTLELIGFRCTITQTWLMSTERARAIISAKP